MDFPTVLDGICLEVLNNLLKYVIRMQDCDVRNENLYLNLLPFSLVCAFIYLMDPAEMKIACKKCVLLILTDFEFHFKSTVV